MFGLCIVFYVSNVDTWFDQLYMSLVSLYLYFDSRIQWFFNVQFKIDHSNLESKGHGIDPFVDTGCDTYDWICNHNPLS